VGKRNQYVLKDGNGENLLNTTVNVGGIGGKEIYWEKNPGIKLIGEKTRLGFKCLTGEGLPPRSDGGTSFVTHGRKLKGGKLRETRCSAVSRGKERKQMRVHWQVVRHGEEGNKRTLGRIWGINFISGKRKERYSLPVTSENGGVKSHIMRGGETTVRRVKRRWRTPNEHKEEFQIRTNLRNGWGELGQ